MKMTFNQILCLSKKTEMHCTNCIFFFKPVYTYLIYLLFLDPSLPFVFLSLISFSWLFPTLSANFQKKVYAKNSNKLSLIIPPKINYIGIKIPTKKEMFCDVCWYMYQFQYQRKMTDIHCKLHVHTLGVGRFKKSIMIIMK